jgi:hypothetical protein
MSDSTEVLPLPNALAFAARGYPILPLHGIRDGKCTCGNPQCGSSGKHPYARFAPHGKDDATTDRATIKQWFADQPFINYGVCTDALPTVDIDPRHCGDKTWLELVRKNYDVHTWRAQTGGGGEHIIFGSTTKPLASGKIGSGIEFQSVGKYIVGVGSLHLSGKRYRWFKDANPLNTELQAPPQWIIERVTKQGAPSKRAGMSRDDYLNSFLEPAAPGQRHEKVASLIGHLFSEKPNRGVLLGLVISHVRLVYPDLSDFGDDEIVKIAIGLANKEDAKREVAA